MTKPEKSTTGVASDSAKMETSCSFCLFGIFRVLILPRTENVMSPFNSINTILQDKMHAFRFINSTWQTVHPPVNSLPSISLCLKRQWMTKKSAKVNTTKFVRQILLIHYSLSQRIFRIHQACLNNLQNSPNPSNSPCFFTIFLSLSFCVLWKVCNAWGLHVDWRQHPRPGWRVLSSLFPPIQTLRPYLLVLKPNRYSQQCEYDIRYCETKDNRQ